MRCVPHTLDDRSLEHGRADFVRVDRELQYWEDVADQGEQYPRDGLDGGSLGGSLGMWLGAR